MFILKLLLILAGTALAAAFGSRVIFADPRTGRPQLRYGPAISAVLTFIVGITLASAFGQIAAGHRGIVLRFGAPTGHILQEGFYGIIPVVNTVVDMNVQTLAYATAADGASKDLQDVKTTVTLNYALNPAKVVQVYRDLRQEYVERIIRPAVQESVKAATALFTAEELITRRQEVRERIEAILNARLGHFGIDVAAVSITEFSFSEAFNAAIEAKVTAQQRALEAERNLQRVRFEAQQRIEQAKAQAESLRIQKENVTRELIALRQIEAQMAAIEKWDGHLPTVVTGSGPVPLLDVFQKQGESTGR